jgi:putative phosphoesterase
LIGQQVQSHPRFRESNSTKIVGLISDNHIPVRARNIPKIVFKIFEDAEFILHAGDLVNLSVIDELELVSPVLAVYGNMDELDVRNKLPRMDSFKLFNWKIGVMHDPGTLFGMGKMRKIAQQNKFDVLVYGHTHRPHVKWDENILFMNPGSPTDPIPPFMVKPSVALLRVSKEKIVPEIVQI